MENMNLLNNLFNTEDIEIVNVNKKYLIIVIIVLVVIGLLLIINKKNYYINKYNVIDDEIILLVEKEYINKIKNSKNITINDVENTYSINTIMPLDNNFLVSIKLNIRIKNISEGDYKIYLGKERLFDYIIRIIRK